MRGLLGRHKSRKKVMMKKQILFVILEQYADWEAAYLSSALYMLGNGEYEVKTVSLSNGYGYFDRRFSGAA